MDPDANLKEQRELAAHIVWAIENNRGFDRRKALRFAELVIALDEWLGNGGFLPKDWQITRRVGGRL